MSKSFIDRLSTDWRELNKFELFIQTFFASLMGTFLFLFISLIISSKDNFWIIFSSFEIIIVVYWIFVMLSGFLENHFNIYDNSKSNSYEGEIFCLCILNIGVFLCCLGIGFAFGVLLTGFALGFIFIFPPYFMFFRRDVYSEPNNIDNDDIGFDPRIFWFLGIFSGFGTIVPSFKFLEAYFLWNSPSLIVCLSLIFISLLWIILVLSPDIWNKYLPFNIKSSNGITKYIVLVLVISIILPFSFGMII